MNFKNEKQLLFAIRYTLLAFILFLSIVITAFLYFENKNDFEKIKKDTEEKFLATEKQLIKEQVSNTYDYIISEQKETENNLKQSLKERTYEAHKIITNLYNQYNDKISKEELRILIKTAIKDIRFNNDRGYFFVYDKNAVGMIHPLIPDFEGKSLIDYQDSKGVYTLKEILSLLEKNDESFYEWYWRRTKDDLTQYRKIGFVKNIYELDWLIGTGEYVEDFTNDVQQKVLSQIGRLRFGENGYFIVTDENNNYLSHINKDLIGKNAFEKIKSASDKNNIEQIEKVIKIGEGFVYLEFFKPSSTKPEYKIIYLKTVPNWKWVISTGFYKNDVLPLIEEEKQKLEENYNHNIKNLILISSVSTIFLLGISFFLSSIIRQKFSNYKNEIEQYVEENKKQSELLSQRTKLVAMGEMIENIAHQWRQPLSLITTASSGIKLQKEMGMLDDEKLDEAVDTIGNSATFLTETIDDFRDFFKPDKQQIKFNLQNSLERTFNLLQSKIKNRDIEVIKNVEDIVIENYERELIQVLLNVIKNAIDALEQKEGKKYIFVDIYKENDFVIIKIKDNAGGISKDIIGRIFEPYFTTKHKAQGTGIGLYMSEEIITRHMNGELLVENSTYIYEDETFTGALFTIKIPID